MQSSQTRLLLSPLYDLKRIGDFFETREELLSYLGEIEGKLDLEESDRILTESLIRFHVDSNSDKVLFGDAEKTRKVLLDGGDSKISEGIVNLYEHIYGGRKLNAIDFVSLIQTNMVRILAQSKHNVTIITPSLYRHIFKVISTNDCDVADVIGLACESSRESASIRLSHDKFKSKNFLEGSATKYNQMSYFIRSLIGKKQVSKSDKNNTLNDAIIKLMETASDNINMSFDFIHLFNKTPKKIILENQRFLSKKYDELYLLYPIIEIVKDYPKSTFVNYLSLEKLIYSIAINSVSEDIIFHTHILDELTKHMSGVELENLDIRNFDNKIIDAIDRMLDLSGEIKEEPAKYDYFNHTEFLDVSISNFLNKINGLTEIAIENNAGKLNRDVMSDREIEDGI